MEQLSIFTIETELIPIVECEPGDIVEIYDHKGKVEAVVEIEFTMPEYAGAARTKDMETGFEMIYGGFMVKKLN